MAKSKLKQALLRAQGIDPVKEKKKKLSQRPSKKAKRAHTVDREGSDDDDSKEEEEAPELVDTALIADGEARADDSADISDEDGTAEVEEASNESNSSEEEGDVEHDDDGDDDDASSVALSDISDNDLVVPDLLPHQKLTIDNHSALTSLLHRIRASSLTSAPFSNYQTFTTDDPVVIDDVHNDLSRELSFYKQALSAAHHGRRQLKAEKVPFERPADYFAEMLKDDEHMGAVKGKLMEEAERKKRSADARKLRELKKFGKQVQTQKLQERARQKRETLEKVNMLKRKRASGDVAIDEDMFDVSLEQQTKEGKRGEKRSREGTEQSRARRAKKDQKYGHGGKKRFKKSGDAISSGDLSGFRQGKDRKVFAGAAKKRAKAVRPGKSKRQARR